MGIVTPFAEYNPPGIGKGYIEKTIDASTAAAFFDVGPRPPNSVLHSFAIKSANTLAAVTAVKYGLGTASNPSLYYLSTDLTPASNIQKGMLHADTNIATTENLRISACSTGGTAAGTIGGGAGNSIEVRVTWQSILPTS
jgi:hypothetical protein